MSVAKILTERLRGGSASWIASVSTMPSEKASSPVEQPATQTRSVAPSGRLAPGLGTPPPGRLPPNQHPGEPQLPRGLAAGQQPLIGGDRWLPVHRHAALDAALHRALLVKRK